MIIGIDGSRLSGRQTGTEIYSQQVIATLTAQAQARGHIVRVYVRERVILPAVPNEVIHIQQRHLWTHLGLAREVARRPPDALFIPSHVLPLSCAWHKTPRTVVTIHDVGYRHFPQAHTMRQRLYLDWSTAFTARFANKLIVDSHATQRDVGRFYGVHPSKMTVALLGRVPVPEISADAVQAMRAKFNLPTDTPYVLHVGTRQPRKNLRRLMEAFAFAIGVERGAWSVERGTRIAPRPVLVLAGGAGWGGEDLHAEAQRLGITDQVRLTGYVDDLEKAALLRHAAAYACPSLYEGFGLPMLEAQSVGVPVICSNTSSLPEVAGDGALLFDPLDVPAMAQALTQVLTDPDTHARLVLAGNNNLARFSWDTCAAIVLAQIEAFK